MKSVSRILLLLIGIVLIPLPTSAQKQNNSGNAKTDTTTVIKNKSVPRKSPETFGDGDQSNPTTGGNSDGTFGDSDQNSPTTDGGSGGFGDSDMGGTIPFYGEILATGITLDQSTLSFNAANQTVTLTATVTPSNATNKDVTWTSSNTAVATVSSAGVVTAVATGTATITATTADGTNLAATCTVTVELPLPGIASLSELSNDKLYVFTTGERVLQLSGNHENLEWNNASVSLNPDDMGLVTNVSQLSSPFTEPSEGSLAALLDNDAGTFWHSIWSSGEVAAHSHYLQVDLVEPADEDICLLFTRRLTGNDHITQWGVFGSNDPDAADADWTELASLNTPYAGQYETLVSKAFDTQGYRYLRFYIDNTTGDGNGTRGFGHLSEFRLFKASDLAAPPVNPAFTANNQFAILNINSKYYLYSPVVRSFYMINTKFISGFGSIFTIQDDSTGDDYRWTLTAPLDGGTRTLGANVKIIPADDFDPTEALAAFTENANLGFADGYYRIRSAGTHTNTVTDGEGNESTEQVYKYACGSIDVEGNLYGSWCTPEGLVSECSALWRLTNRDGLFDLQNMCNNGRFIGQGKGVSAQMSAESKGLVAIDWVAEDGGVKIVNIRMSSSPIADYNYLHREGHQDGAGVSGNLCGWCNTGTYGASEWVLEPVSTADAEAIINSYSAAVEVGTTFTAAVPCGEGTADLTFKVWNSNLLQVIVYGSPEDIAGDLVIPAKVTDENGIEFSVWGIGDNAFNNRTNLTAVEMPESVTTIGGSAFYGCTGLTSVTILGDVDDIWGHGFENCTSLQNVTINGVTNIDDSAFKGCTSLQSIVLPEGLTKIGEAAFHSSGLESISFPSTLTEVGESAFHSCHQLTNIDFNGCSAVFAGNAFAWCESLEEVYIPNTVTLGGYFTFACCASLREVVFEEGNPTRGIFSTFIGDYISSSLETVVLPSFEFMDTGCFSNCTNLKSVTFLSGSPNNNSQHFSKNFFNVPDDVLFTVPAGTAENYLRAGFKNLSDKGGLPLVREEFEAEAARIATMADALSDGDKTTLNTAITSARTTVNATDDYMTIYAQITAIKTAAKTFLTTATLPANFDVTAATIINPDIDRYPIGWNMNNFAEHEGYQAGHYENGVVSIDKFIEAARGNVLADGQISQTITSLPAGIYRLEADIIATWWFDASVEVTGVSLFAGNQSTPVATENQKPQHFSVEFTLDEDGDCTIGLSINSTTANWVAMDNVRLYNVGLPEDENDTDISEMDNVIYIERAEGVAGSSASLAVKMKNVLSPVGCSFKLTLPEGFSLVKDTDNDIVYELSNRAKKFSVTRKDWNNGTYDFALTPSTENATISGTEGIVITFRVQVPEGTSLGDYKVNLTNNLIQSKSSGTTQDNPVPDVKTTFTVVDYVLGDVNGDGNVTPADAIMILYRYFEVAQSGFNEAAADINGDGNISPADAIEALYQYFGVSNGSNVKPFINIIQPE